MTETTALGGQDLPGPGEKALARPHAGPGAPAMGTAPAGQPPPGPGRRGGLILAVLLVGQFIVALDLNAVNVALPTLRADLGASDGALQLVVAGYSLSYAVLLISGARVGRLFGHRRMFLTGLALFTLASAACGLAPTTGGLVAFRVVQGAAGALMTPQIMSLIQQTFSGAARARALGLYTAMIAGGVVVGQVAGGLLVSADLFGFGWRPVFLVNVPVGLAALVAGRTLPADRGHRGVGLDLPGLAVVSPALAAIVVPLILGRDQGWPAWCVASIMVGSVLLAVFALVEHRVAARGGHPLVPARVLRAPGLLAAAVALLLTSGTWGAYLFTTTLHLQGDLGLGALRSGLAFIPALATFGLVGLTWQRLPARLHRVAIPVGTALATVCFALLGPLAGGGVPFEVLAGLIGLGLGVMPIVMTIALEHVAPVEAADASGLLLTVMQLGQVIGVTAIGSVFLASAQASHSTRHAEYATGWALAASGLVAVGVTVGLLRAGRARAALAGAG